MLVLLLGILYKKTDVIICSLDSVRVVMFSNAC